MENEAKDTVSSDGLAADLVAEVKKEVKPVEAEARLYRFTKRAHKRVANSIYSRELNKLFTGQFNVDLLDVERAILDFQKEDPDSDKKGLMLDPSSAEELTSCELQIANVCMVEFMPKKWDPKEGKKDEPGSYVPDLLDEEGKEFVLLAICPACYQIVCDEVARENVDIGKKNAELRKQGKPLMEEKFFPRSLSLASAQDAFDRREYAIKMQKEGKQIARENKQKRFAETKQDTRRVVSRIGQPKISRGVNLKNGTRYGRRIDEDEST